jgi:hypothetical protein
LRTKRLSTASSRGKPRGSLPLGRSTYKEVLREILLKANEFVPSDSGSILLDDPLLTFVPVNFSRDDTFEKLRAAGYDPTKKTLYLGGGNALLG